MKLHILQGSCTCAGLSSLPRDYQATSIDILTPEINSGAQGRIYRVTRVDDFPQRGLLAKVFDESIPNNLRELLALLSDRNVAEHVDACGALRALPLFLFECLMDRKTVGGYVMREMPGRQLSRIQDEDINTYINLPLAERLGYCWQFAEGMGILYVLTVVHADVNGQNLLIDTASKTLGIIDVDGGAVAKNGSAPLVIGKNDPNWIDPKIWEQELSSKSVIDVNITADLWSIGCGVHNLLVGLAPFFFMQQLVDIPSYLKLHQWPQMRGLNGIATRNSSAFGYYERAFEQVPALQPLFRHTFQRGYLNPSDRIGAAQWLVAIKEQLRELGAGVPAQSLPSGPAVVRTPSIGSRLVVAANVPRPPALKAPLPLPSIQPLSSATGTRHASAVPPQASMQGRSSATSRLGQGWAIALGVLAALLFLSLLGPIAARLGRATLPAGATWLTLIATGWFYATSALVGATVTCLLRANRKRAGTTAVFATAMALAFAAVVGVANVAARFSGPSGTSPPVASTRLEGQIVGSLKPASSVPTWLRTALGPRSIAPENYPPPPDFQIRDRCAGEGCGYQRPWRALKDGVPLFATWGQPRDEPVYTVADREVVNALSGIFIVNKPAVWEVQQPINIGGVDLHQGDLIYVLLNLGEGYVRGFFHGKIANFSPDVPGGPSSGRTGSMATIAARTQTGANVHILNIGSPTDPKVSRDFLRLAGNPSNTALGGTVIAPPYALQVWGNENGGGQALLKQSPSGTWTLRSLGGGLSDVQALVHDGVPQATAEHLIAGLYTPPAAIRHLSDDYQSVLWVQMKTGTGIIGWTNDAGYPSFDGQYKLFTYILPETAAEQNGTWDYELGVQAEKPSSLRIGPTVIPVAANSFVKVHTGYVLHAGETQSIELVAKEDGELLAKTFVRPGTPVQNVSGSSATPAGQGPSKEGDRALGDLLGQARTLFENGQYELALVRCNALLDKYPRNAEATDLKSKIEKAISILGRSTQAVASLQKQDALSAPPDLLQQAQTLFERGQYSVALSRCNDLLAKYPGDQKAIDLKRKIQTAIDVLKQ